MRIARVTKPTARTIHRAALVDQQFYRVSHSASSCPPPIDPNVQSCLDEVTLNGVILVREGPALF